MPRMKVICAARFPSELYFTRLLAARAQSRAQFGLHPQFIITYVCVCVGSVIIVL